MSALLPAWLAPIGCLLLAAGAVGIGLCLVFGQATQARLRRHEQRLERELRYLRPGLAARQVLIAQLAAAAGSLLLSVVLRATWPLLPAAAAVFVPGLLLERERLRRRARIDAQLDTWLLALANALRANPSLPAALAASAELVAAPLSGELDRAASEQQLGVSLDAALRHMAERIRSPVASTALAVLRVARAAGGDLSHTLEAAAASLREMARLEGVVRTKTAEGRAQAAAIAAAPLLLVALLDRLDPGLLAPLWNTRLGQLIALAAFGLWAAALLLARRISAVDV